VTVVVTPTEVDVVDVTPFAPAPAGLAPVAP
jgi:hypothetical protein